MKSNYWTGQHGRTLFYILLSLACLVCTCSESSMGTLQPFNIHPDSFLWLDGADGGVLVPANPPFDHSVLVVLYPSSKLWQALDLQKDRFRSPNKEVVVKDKWLPPESVVVAKPMQPQGVPKHGGSPLHTPQQCPPGQVRERWSAFLHPLTVTDGNSGSGP